MFVLNSSRKNVQAKGEYVIIGVFSCVVYSLLLWSKSATRTYAASFLRFLGHEQIDTPTDGMIPLNEWSARRRGRYLHCIQRTQETNIYARGGIRTRDPSYRTAADLRLRLRGQGSACVLFTSGFQEK